MLAGWRRWVGWLEVVGAKSVEGGCVGGGDLCALARAVQLEHSVGLWRPVHHPPAMAHTIVVGQSRGVEASEGGDCRRIRRERERERACACACA